MAEKTISVIAPLDNPIHLEFLPDGKTLIVSSKDIALHFQKKHKDILREIDRIRLLVPKDFNERNFTPVTYQDAKGETRPAFMLTRDAFHLLAMGFTGKAAIAWKLRYIEAFNVLERAVQENLRREGLQEGLRLSATTLERRELMRRAVRYRAMGLSQTETGKLLDRTRQAVQNLLKDATLLGIGGAS